MTERQRLQQEMAELEKRIDSRISLLREKIIAHQDYHFKNESRWGLIKMMREHPFKTMVAGMFLGMVLAISIPHITGKELIYWIIRFFK